MTKENDNTTLHELSNVACALNKTEVLKINNTSDFINDKHAGHAENIMSLLIYMVYKLKIPKEVYDLKNLNNEPG